MGHTYIATYILNWPRGKFSEEGNAVYSYDQLQFLPRRMLIDVCLRKNNIMLQRVAQCYNTNIAPYFTCDNFPTNGFEPCYISLSTGHILQGKAEFHISYVIM